MAPSARNDGEEACHANNKQRIAGDEEKPACLLFVRGHARAETVQVRTALS